MNLPELNQSVFDEAMLWQVAEDIATLTEVMDVQVKGGAERYAERGPDFRGAVGALARREVRGLQVHYRWDGVEWVDTLLLAGGDGFRIVRTSLPPA